MDRFEEQGFSFSEDELADLRALPPASQEELEAIKNETPAETERAVRRIFEQALDEVFPLRPRKRPFREISQERVEQLRWSSSRLSEQALPPQAILSSPALVAWRRHVACNLGLLDPAKTNPESCGVLRWRQPRLPELEEFLARNPIELVPRIGSHLGAPIAAALLVGPKSNRLLISYELVSQPLEMGFLVYHIYVHAAAGHVKHGEFGIRFEYDRGRAPSAVVAAPEYGVEEAIADDGATCLWDDWYVDSYQMSEFSRDLVRGALLRGIRPGLIRTFLKNRQGVFHVVWRRLGGALARAKNTSLYPLLAGLSPALTYRGAIAVAEGSDRQAYLLCVDENGHRWRRWITSRKVLARLGLAPKDIVTIPDEELYAYQDGRILIVPQEVAQARAILEKTTDVSPWPSVFVSALSRLEGVRKAACQPLPGGDRLFMNETQASPGAGDPADPMEISFLPPSPLASPAIQARPPREGCDPCAQKEDDPVEVTTSVTH